MFKSSFFRSLSVYTISSAINGAIPFFLLPILTRFLSPSDYGTLAMFSILVSIITSIAGLSIHGALFNKYYQREVIDLGSYLGNSLIILAITTLGSAALLLMFQDYVYSLTEFPKSWMWAIVITAFFNFIITARLNLLQAEDEPIIYGKIQIGWTLVNVALSLSLVIMLNMGWQGRVIAQVFSTSIISTLCLRLLHKSYTIKLATNSNYIKDALRFGIPLVPHSLGALFITLTDRVMITKMVSIADTGVYTVALQIGMLFSFATESFNKAYAPWLFKKLKERDASTLKKIVQLTYIYFAVVLLISLSPLIVPDVLFNIFLGPAFSEAKYFISPIFLGFAFNGMYYMVCNYIFFAEKTKYLAIITLFSGVLNIMLTYFLIGRFSAIGAAYASTISFLITFLLTWILSNRVYPMPWKTVILEIFKR